MRNKKKGRFTTVVVIEKKLRHHIIEWMAALLSAIGAILNSNLFNITGFDTYFYSFCIWLVANFLWISFALKHKHWGVLATFSIYAVINFLAIIKNLGFI